MVLGDPAREDPSQAASEYRAAELADQRAMELESKRLQEDEEAEEAAYAEEIRLQVEEDQQKVQLIYSLIFAPP